MNAASLIKNTRSKPAVRGMPAAVPVLILLALCVLFFHKVIFGIGNFWEDLVY
jgi:hypothetical protein